MMTRHKDVDVESRLDMLSDLKAKGYRYSQLVQMAVQRWNISERQAKRYMHEIAEREMAFASKPLREILGTYLAQNQHLYYKAMQADNLELAHKINSDRIRHAEKLLKPLPSGEKANEKVPDSSTIQPEELEKLLAELEKEWPEA